MIVDAIYAAAAAQAAQRKAPRLGAHNCGKCVRAMWYTAHGAPAEALDGRALLLFDLGDRVEDSVLHWLGKTSIPFIRTDRREDTVRLAGYDIGVRSDFICELGGELVGGEIKSMSDFAFDRAQRGILDEAYLCQVEANLRAFELQVWVVICYRKQTSHLHELWLRPSQSRWDKIARNLTWARSEHLPPRPYQLDAACSGCDGTGKTPKLGRDHKACGGSGLEPGGPYLPTWECGYCAFKGPCWGELTLVMRQGRPRWRAVAAPPDTGEQAGQPD